MPRLSKIGAAALAAFGWTSGSSVSASYLVVAGGGSGFYSTGSGGVGGGGAGGLLTGTISLNPTLSYTVTVGAGGASASNTSSNGSASSFSTITTVGGGGGGAGNTAGNSGGSGGGAGESTGATISGGAGTSGQGNTGGSSSGNNSAGAGGGGASATGGASSTQVAGNGGAGTASSISGTSVTYAGGGGGASYINPSSGGAGGAGGGGTGTIYPSVTVATAGSPNTGGGGGALGGSRGNTGNTAGGSGVVIISYVGAQQFGGGNVTSSGGNTIHTFTTSGTLSPLSSLTAQYLIVAGGGGGGGAVNDYTVGGGGGAGGLLTNTGVTIDTNSNYVVTVGAGGAGGTYNALGSSGGNSAWSIVSTTALGGGVGSAVATAAATSGGSGGGGGSSSTPAGGSGTSGQGNAGGTGLTFFSGAGNKYGAGGGGAGAVGSAGSGGTGGAGGVGVASSISGTSTYYAGGGGGAGTSTGGAGGNGGGGAGVTYNNDGTAGTAYTGGGGGGAARNNTAGSQLGGNGGSGVVIISYPGSTQQMAGGTVTISGGNVIHTFTTSGYLTPIKYASRSLRFRSSASAYLNRTFKTPTSGSIWTYSTWVKRGILGSSNQQLLSAGASVSDQIYFQGGSTDKLIVYLGGSQTTTQVFRDPSAWYHIVIAVDTTQATNTNRLKLYVNGSQVTAFDATSYPTQNSTTKINSAVDHYISRYAASAGDYIDGYMTEVNFVDGAALTPSSFGTFNSYGVWQPITYGGSYGTNGFYLTFGNNTSTTTLGYDTSPAGNNWTTNNISVTAGATYDSMTDVPTLTSATAANYAVLNPIVPTGAAVISGGNLNIVSSGTYCNGLSTLSLDSGAYYAECVVTTHAAEAWGVWDTTKTAASNTGTTPSGFYGIYSGGATLMSNGTNVTTNSAGTPANGDIVQLAWNNGKVWVGKNNTWYDSSFGTTGNPSAGTNATFTGLTVGQFAFMFGAANATVSLSANFGQRPFTYTAPTGFVALNTYNLSTPTIPNGATQMAATLYTGTGATQVVTNTVNGTAMQPDWVWQKSRSAARDHRLIDTVRGINNVLASNLTAAEYSGSMLSSVNSNGFTLNTADQGNNNGETYVAWQWKANAGTNVTNTSGTITSTVSANTTAGFSVVTYTGTGSNATVGHGLGVAPSFIIVKKRSSTGNWQCWNSSFTGTQYISLNLTTGVNTSSAVYNGSPTSTIFNIGTDTDVNASGATYVAYVFTAVAGYSAFGSYTGNGSSDGPFIYTGFRPRFFLAKISSGGSGGWHLIDTSRSPYNEVSVGLYPNLNNAESSDFASDILSNGLKMRNTQAELNGSGNTYIYMAFAENPFKYSNAR